MCLIVVFVVGAFHVNLEEAVELHLLSAALEGEGLAANGNLNLSLLKLGVGHLAGYSALPDELVQAALCALGVDGLSLEVGGAYSLVSLLSALGLSLVAACLYVFKAVLVFNLLLGHTEGELAEVHAVGTHVGDVTALVQLLSHLHSPCYAEAQFAAGLLLQGAGGERRCGHTAQRLGLNLANLEAGIYEAAQEGFCLLGSVVVVTQFGVQGFAALDGAELGRHTEVRLAYEVFDFLLALHDEAHSHALHASGAQRGFDFAPEDGADFVANQAVEHAASLLGVHQVHVNLTRVLDGVQDGSLGNLIEHDSLGGLGVQFQCFLQMPSDGLSFAVLIGCEPHHVGVLHSFLEFAHQRAFVVANLVLRLVVVVHVDTHLFFREVADVAVTRLHGVVFAEKFLDGLCLSRRLNYY